MLLTWETIIPVCRDVGNIEKITVTGIGSWVEPDTFVADDVEYGFGIKPSATRLCGFTRCCPIQNIKNKNPVACDFGIPSKLKSAGKGCCDDPRILCVVNRIWNLDLRGEYNDQDKIDEAIRIPTHEEALKYLLDREYTASCISDEMMNEYCKKHPGWEDRMYQPD